jgi:chromosome partitioning protein
MKVITLLNEKGGVGKTTLAITLACGLAIQGHNVMVADTDMQANATTRLGLPKEKSGGFYDLIVRDAPLQSVVRQVENARIGTEVRGNVFMIPGNEQNMFVASAVSSVNVVFDALQPLAAIVDYIIIDTSPTQTMLHGAIYMAGDAVIYPTLLAADSVRGVIETNSRREIANQMRQGMGRTSIQVLGIQAIAANLRQVVDQHMLDTLRDRFGEKVLPVINRRVTWEESAASDMSIFAYAPESAAAEEALAFVNAVVSGIEVQ